MSGKAIRETLGFLAVVAGLVFVGVEIQQNSRSVQVAAYQDLIAQISALNTLVIENPDFAELVVGSRESLTPVQQLQHTALLWLLFRHGDMAYYQYERGVLDDDRLLSATGPLRQQLRDPFVQGEWTRLYRNAFVPIYQDDVDRLIAAVQ